MLPSAIPVPSIAWQAALSKNGAAKASNLLSNILPNTLRRLPACQSPTVPEKLHRIGTFFRIVQTIPISIFSLLMTAYRLWSLTDRAQNGVSRTFTASAHQAKAMRCLHAYHRLF
ncbi:hypothetical protein MKZ38_004958 [Zalerion maritima]|uniref:Uncharacterized protein n=1 Tax=Zalerion maritima TaxID=339359 RepID=A0AAD5RLS4_9PEZI|nr:hypothetical protein MKZ38_004958 [Zalerion maritima]